MRRKKGRLRVCKLRERNGTDAGCCILPASAGMRRWNGGQHTGIVWKWQGHLDVASSRILREMNGVEMSMEVWSAVEAGQRSRYGG
jgi:hypothetical protein